MKKKENFLLSAINDIQETIHFLDTKVAFIMGIIGIIWGALVGCKSNIYYIYKQTMGFRHFIFVITMLAYGITNIIVFYFSIRAILPRYKKVDMDVKKKIWYPGSTITFDEYFTNVQNVGDNEIIELLAYELFCINSIRKSKETAVRRAILFFSGSMVSLGIIGCFMIMIYA